MDQTPLPSVAEPSFGDSPYRARLDVPRRPAPRRGSPFRAMELGALAALVMIVDVCLWSPIEGIAAGGAGWASLFVAAPLVIVLGARARRASPRLAITLGLLGAIAVRVGIAPTVVSVMVGLALALSVPFALRARRAPRSGRSSRSPIR